MLRIFSYRYILYISLIILHGFPYANTLPGSVFVTTLPAPIVTLSPMVTPGIIILLTPIQTLLPIHTGAVLETAKGKPPLLLTLKRSFAPSGWKKIYGANKGFSGVKKGAVVPPPENSSVYNYFRRLELLQINPEAHTHNIVSIMMI